MITLLNKSLQIFSVKSTTHLAVCKRDHKESAGSFCNMQFLSVKVGQWPMHSE